ncbi:hypothetical protein BDZ90DRAFT_232904 [Jaminaea rosea]|uniref:Uncharacterized protein n=1 Tax=Jaminaea rosea TaxID=1569628 RepID=A0A316UNB7_9BASI|nr:hypothetical protein BDZ90DRAFT_232904 [Jaminaea rosea]PWN26802.1 hypothetical protein BDZ90DRAFT_232904 [Jaminaea rosea]
MPSPGILPGSRPSNDSMRSNTSWPLLPDGRRKSQLRTGRMVIDSPTSIAVVGGAVTPEEAPRNLSTVTGGPHRLPSAGGNSEGSCGHSDPQRSAGSRAETPRFFAQRFYDIPSTATTPKETDVRRSRRRLVDLPETKCVGDSAPIRHASEPSRPSTDSFASRDEEDFWTPSRSPSAAAMVRSGPTPDRSSAYLMPPIDLHNDPLPTTDKTHAWQSRSPVIHSRPLVLPQVATLAAFERQARPRAPSLKQVYCRDDDPQDEIHSASAEQAHFGTAAALAARCRSHSTGEDARWSIDSYRSDMACLGDSGSENGDDGHYYEHEQDSHSCGASCDSHSPVSDAETPSTPVQLVQVAKKSIARTDAILLVGRGAKHYVEAGVQAVPQIGLASCVPGMEFSHHEASLNIRRSRPQLTIDTVMCNFTVAKTASLPPALADSKPDVSATLPSIPAVVQCPNCQHCFDWVGGKGDAADREEHSIQPSVSPAVTAKSLARARVEARSAMRSSSLGRVEELESKASKASLRAEARTQAATPASLSCKYRNIRSADGPQGTPSKEGSFTPANDLQRSATPQVAGRDYPAVDIFQGRITPAGSMKSRFDPSSQRSVATPDLQQHHLGERPSSRTSFTDSITSKLRHHRDSFSCLPLPVHNNPNSSVFTPDSRSGSSVGSLSGMVSKLPSTTALPLRRKHTQTSGKSNETTETTPASFAHHALPEPVAQPLNEVCPWEDEEQPQQGAIASCSNSVAAVRGQSAQWKIDGADLEDDADLSTMAPRTPSKSKALKVLGIPDPAASAISLSAVSSCSASRSLSKRSDSRSGSSGHSAGSRLARRVSVKTSISSSFEATHISGYSRSPNLAGVGATASSPAQPQSSTAHYVLASAAIPPPLASVFVGSRSRPSRVRRQPSTQDVGSQVKTGTSNTSSAVATTGSTATSNSGCFPTQRGGSYDYPTQVVAAIQQQAAALPSPPLPPPSSSSALAVPLQEPSSNSATPVTPSSGLRKLRHAFKRGAARPASAGNNEYGESRPHSRGGNSAGCGVFAAAAAPHYAHAVLAGSPAIWPSTPERPMHCLPPRPCPSSPLASSGCTPLNAPAPSPKLTLPAATAVYPRRVPSDGLAPRRVTSIRLPPVESLESVRSEREEIEGLVGADDPKASISAGRRTTPIEGAHSTSAATSYSGSSGTTDMLDLLSTGKGISSLRSRPFRAPSTNGTSSQYPPAQHHQQDGPPRQQRERSKSLTRRRREFEAYYQRNSGSDWNPRVDYL